MYSRSREPLKDLVQRNSVYEPAKPNPKQNRRDDSGLIVTVFHFAS